MHPGAWVESISRRGEAVVPREASRVLSFPQARPLRGTPVHFRVRPSAPLPLIQAFVSAMAELIQKKLQGEVEKYQQLQKGKGARARSM